jgi:hypothetical protein
MAAPLSFGTAFAQAGFSFDPNLSPNNQGFSNAVYATVVRLAGPISTAIAPSLLGDPTNKVSGTATLGTSSLAMRRDAAPALDWAQSPTWTGNHIFNPPSGTPLQVQVNSVTGFQVVNTSSIAARGPQAAALVDMTPDIGTFTCTLVGVSNTVNPVVTARRMGAFATLTFAAGVIGTSNANSMSLTGLPAAWQPSLDTFMPVNLEDNTVNVEGLARVSPGSGTITFSVSAVVGTRVTHTVNGFTASGQKGFNLTQIGPYPIT